MWQDLYLTPLTNKLANSSTLATTEANNILKTIICQDHKLWKKHPIIEELGSAYGDNVVAAYGDIIEELQQKMFGSFKVSQQVKSALKATVRFMHATVPIDGSGIVVAGMGETDLFPILLHYRVGNIAAGKLRCAKVDEIRVTRDDEAVIAPFAQRETIDMIIGGIFPDLKKKVVETNARYSLRSSIGNRRFRSRPQNAARNFDTVVKQEIQQKYAQPFMAAVAALPRHDLAAMAEALVNLTKFRARMSVTQMETVGGPTDIAILSKGDGFVWVKRKDPHWGSGSPATIEVL